MKSERVWCPIMISRPPQIEIMERNFLLLNTLSLNFSCESG
jgi:hypothetical protein